MRQQRGALAIHSYPEQQFERVQQYDQVWGSLAQMEFPSSGDTLERSQTWRPVPSR